MAVSVAKSLAPDQVTTFDNIHLREDYQNILEVERLSQDYKQLPTAVGAIPGSDNVKGDPAAVNDNDNATSVKAQDAPADFPTIYVGKEQTVRAIEVSWTPKFAPVEYFIEGRSTLVEAWTKLPGTHRPNTSALGTDKATDTFEVEANYNFYRVVARLTNQPMQLVDMRFYGKGSASHTRYVVANMEDVVVQEDSTGQVQVKNVSNRTLELAVQHTR